MSSMRKQHMTPQTPQHKRKYATWAYWLIFAIMVVGTVTLIGLVIWLFATQKLDQFSTEIGIMAAIAAIISAPLLFFFTVFKKPETEKEQPEGTPLPPPSPIAPAQGQNTAPASPLWNVPYRHNPFFTGREQLITQLHKNLTTHNATAVTQAQAVNGLGGIGKTEMVIEYAYRYRHEYAAVFWINAASRETLFADVTTTARLLHLPIPDERDQQAIVRSVNSHVAAHADYLLIFDNADDLALLDDFIPLDYQCHILITTREHATSRLAVNLEVASMDDTEGRAMLLRRAKVLLSNQSIEQIPQHEQEAATRIIQTMDGLPLALDQAGAYIEETQCSLATYLERYQQEAATLLQRRGTTGKAHPEPVATTWSLSFAKIEQLNPLAAELLRFYAFLAPDDIPEQLLRDGASHLGSLLQAIKATPSLLDEAIGTLLRFSFVKRKRDEQTIAVHRLVQTIQRTSMDTPTQHTWAERTVRAVNHAFPDVGDYRNWLRCQQYLPHALICFNLITTYHLASPEAGRLLNQTAYYLHDQAQYAQALPLYQRALAIREKVLGAEHPDTASSLNNLAALYKTQGDYAQALPLLQRALAIFERALGKNHPSTKTVRANYEQLGRQK